MKHLLKSLAVLLVLVVCLGVSVPAFADDPPPGVDVDVAVVTPGDVDFDVDINAGGDVSFDINGAPMASQQQVAVVQDQMNQYIIQHMNGNGMYDYVYYWKITGIGPRIEGQIAELRELTGLSMDAITKLIIGKQTLDNQTTQLTARLDKLGLRLAIVTKESEQEDEKIMDKVVYGAETHIAINEQSIDDLSYRVDVNQRTVDSQTAQLNAQIQVLETARVTDFNNLTAYIQRVRHEYISMFEGVACVLFALVVSLGLVGWKVIRLRKLIK